jgi:hypothetical protein
MTSDEIKQAYGELRDIERRLKSGERERRACVRATLCEIKRVQTRARREAARLDRKLRAMHKSTDRATADLTRRADILRARLSAQPMRGGAGRRPQAGKPVPHTTRTPS